MSRSSTPHLARAPGSPRSARHSQQGCRGQREAGATPQPPSGVAPNPVSTVVARLKDGSPLPAVPQGVMAVLTTFEGQAVFRIIKGADRDNNDVVPGGDIFRLCKGSRTHGLRGVTP